MSRKNMLPIIVFAILSGFCVSACGGEDSPVGRMLNNLNSDYHENREYYHAVRADWPGSVFASWWESSVQD